MSPSRNPKFKNPRAKYNFQGRTCSISGVGSYLPAKVLTNADLEGMVDTSDEWITSRTGIKERRLAAKNEFTSDLGAQAALRAMHRAGVTAAVRHHVKHGDHAGHGSQQPEQRADGDQDPDQPHVLTEFQ